VWYLWFGEFKIATFALPIIGIGGICILLGSKREKLKRIGKLLVGFGLLFIGIWFMKDSVDALRDSFDLAAYKDMSLWGFGLIGVIVTLVIQSSSAMSVMTFAALASNIITFPASIAIVMGANIGTTMTGVVASLGGAVAKRQLSVAQVLFNVISALIGILLFWQLIKLTGFLIDIEKDPVFANAILNTIFNVFTALLFAPFIAPFTKLVKRIIPDAKDTQNALTIDELDPSLATEIDLESYITAVEWDIQTLDARVLDYVQAPFADDFKTNDHEASYNDLQIIADKILQYFTILDAPASLEQGLQNQVVQKLKSAKHIKNVSHSLSALKADDRFEYQELYAMMKDAVTGYVSSPESAEGYGAMLDSYYTRHIQTLATLWKDSEDTDLDSASLINMVREVEEAIKVKLKTES